LKKSRAFKVAVSPFIGNRAFSGPAKELTEAIGYEGSSAGLAELYSGWIDLLVIHEQDVNQKGKIRALGIEVLSTRTMMKTVRDKKRLAQEILDFYRSR
jgi:LPPG:FO 2-phospho-L-lactate transferase